MENLIPFEFKNQKVRALVIDNVSWWVAKDVCQALGLENVTMATATLRDDEKRRFTVCEPNINTKDPNFINDEIGAIPRTYILISEPGLYRLAFRSRKPEAEEFQLWVTHEVLPTIRRTGSYSVNSEPVVEKTRQLPPSSSVEKFDRFLDVIEPRAKRIVGWFTQRADKRQSERDAAFAELIRQMQEAADKRQSERDAALSEQLAQIRAAMSIDTIGSKGAERISRVLKAYAKAVSHTDEEYLEVWGKKQTELRDEFGYCGKDRGWHNFPNCRWPEMDRRLKKWEEETERATAYQLRLEIEDKKKPD